jgi:hypothetical protein
VSTEGAAFTFDVAEAAGSAAGAGEVTGAGFAAGVLF